MTAQNEEQLATVPSEEPPAPYGVDDLSIVRIYNADLDAYGEAPRAGVQHLVGWEVVDPTPAQASQVTSYDPAAHSVSEVLEYLGTVSETERDAILVLEREGKNRTTLVDHDFTA